MKYNVLVTGGAGFIGSHVVDDLIKQGHHVKIIDNLSSGSIKNLNPRAEFLKGDLSNKGICKKAVENVDIVYHLAAHCSEVESIFSPVMNANLNYMGFLQLITECINQDVKKFINVGSAASYGKQKNFPILEDYKKNPRDPYAIGKLAIEQILDVYRETFGLSYVTLLPHNVYGPRQPLSDPYKNVIGIFINRIMQNKPPRICGDGSQKRSFTYISDCAPYIAKAGFTNIPSGESINLGNEEEISIKELAELILNIMHSRIEPVFVEKRPIELTSVRCSSSKARGILGYTERTNLEEGLTKTINWAIKEGPQKFKYRELEINKLSGFFKEND